MVANTAPGSVGDILQFRLLDYDPDRDEYRFTCQTAQWMRNFSGTLHGGMCAAVLDQAMGVVAYSLKTEDGTCPTVQMEVEYHRPLIPGEGILVKVRVISMTKSLINLTAEAFRASRQDKICLSGSGIFFRKPADPEKARD